MVFCLQCTCGLPRCEKQLLVILLDINASFEIFSGFTFQVIPWVHLLILESCYAGLLMATSVLTPSLRPLHSYIVRCCSSGCLAGSEFQPGYQQLLQSHLHKVGLQGQVQFVGQLDALLLANSGIPASWCVQFNCSEAFGIAVAELMAAVLH